MTIVTSRADFEKLMVLRMGEAKFLIDEKQDWDGAYYLAGYAVEFALKIRIITRLMKSDSFPDRKLAENFLQARSHDSSQSRRAGRRNGQRHHNQSSMGHREGLERTEPVRDRYNGAGSEGSVRRD